MIRPSTLRGAPGLLVTLFAACFTPALSACGAATRGAVLSCTAPSDCGPAALCVQGACQASSPPVADFTPPAALTTNRAVAVTATAHDPDRDDSVATWAWSITRLAAACEADADVADAATLRAVFWCAGTYQVSLVVSDSVGVQSEPVRRTITVAELPLAPSVAVGPAVTVQHRCAGLPLRCELEQVVALEALGTAPLGGPVTYEWTATPPDASRGAAVAHLAPSASGATPTLTIQSDGGAVSGGWRLRVRAKDASGNLAQATQLVTVGNRPPVIDDAPLWLDHRYGGGAYLADGALAVPVSDPDGDPLELGLELLEPAGSGCSAGLSGVAGASGTFSLSCPGAAGVLASGRALRATASDVNGAAAAAQVALQVRNRLPVLRPRAEAGATEVEVGHSVGPCPDGSGQCFLASGPNPFVVDDPDGDPVTAITLVPGVEPARTTSTAEVLGGDFRFGTPVTRPTEFRAADGASGFWLTATASDPFGASAPAEPLAVRIGNRPPVLKTASPAVTVSHRYDRLASEYQAFASLAVFEDPDGDPLRDGGSGGDESCAAVTFGQDGAAGVACRRHYLVGAGGYPALSGFAGTHLVTAVATDGWGTSSASTAVTIGSAPPTVPTFTGAIEACTCRCAMWEVETPGLCAVEERWVADTRNAVFQPRPADADGDPLAATFSTAAQVTPAFAVQLPEACTTTLSSITFPVSVVVTVNDGVSQASGTWTATHVVCAKEGLVCGQAVPPLAGPSKLSGAGAAASLR